ncbi:heparin lyase I family protein [Flavobacterium flavipallidum]|uniref:Heparin lyase I family protein n=1 Tax=Flavobacterium flavipallidum TaxID=3139140 RepID=A0ABU9HQI0_9FLAO
MKKSLLVLICVFALIETKAQNSAWLYDFGTAAAAPYTSTTYSSSYLPTPLEGGGNAAVRASSTTEGPIELTSSNWAGGSGAELKITGGTTVSGAKFGLAPFNGTTVASLQCKINIHSGSNGRFLLYIGNGSNFTTGSSVSVPQTFASLRFSPTATAVNLDWLSSSTSPNYNTTGLSQTTINKNQSYVLKFYMNNSNNTASYVTENGSSPTTHNLAAGTFDIWIDNMKVLTNADPGTGLLPQGTAINGVNLLNVGAGSSAPVMYIDDISYSNFLIPTPPVPPATVTNSLVSVDYESGTENSGISNLNTTNATAADAEYIVSPGRTGNYAIAHRVTIGDSGYFSDNHWRSEAATAQMFDTGKYYPGDERRFETSLLLKDWEPYTPGMAQNGDIIFQGKQSGGENPAWYLSAKRNSITFRIPNDNIEPTIIEDFRPYINQWIDFRVDAKMTTDATGYYKVYYRLPGQTEYTLAYEISNHRTFNQDVPEENPSGYLKWGLYRPGQSITTDPPNVATRIIYHDDIRIFKLNNNSAPVQIWGNTLNGTIDFSSPVIIGNISNSNIVNDGSTTPSFFYATESDLNTAGVFSNRVLLNGWTNKVLTSDPATPFNPNQYFEFKLQPASGYKIDFSNLKFTARKGNTADPSMFVMRSSLDGFTNDITTPQSFAGTTATALTYDLSSLSNVQAPITFRLYWYGSNRTGGIPLIGIDDFSFNGRVKPVFNIPEKSDITKSTDPGYSTYTVKANEFDITAVNNCSKTTYNYTLSGATTGSGNGSLADQIFNKGETLVKWVATDECSNSSSVSFIIKINDTEKPIFTAPSAIIVNNDENQCNASIILVQSTVTDNCAVATITNDAPALFPIGITTVTWKATDTSGNMATTTQTVTVIDTQTPEIKVIEKINLCYETSGNYTIPVAISTDNCTANTVTYQINGATIRNGNGIDASGNFNIGISTITWIVTDNAGNSSTAITTVTINSKLTADIADIYSVSPGGQANTIYLGYGPSSLTLSATPTNGTAPYSYSWSNGATNASITVSPSTPGVHSYTATITDALGCSFAVTKEINVIDILCADGKVKLCHSSNPNHDKSLCISTSSVSDHLAHGCYLGNCNTLSSKKNIELAKEVTNEFSVMIAPNPTDTEFHINISSNSAETVSVNVFDISGKRINLLKVNPNQTISFGNNLKSGIYLTEIIQGKNKKTVKLIKQ